jgi:hypothetical protein
LRYVSSVTRIEPNHTARAIRQRTGGNNRRRVSELQRQGPSTEKWAGLTEHAEHARHRHGIPQRGDRGALESGLPCLHHPVLVERDTGLLAAERDHRPQVGQRLGGVAARDGVALGFLGGRRGHDLHGPGHGGCHDRHCSGHQGRELPAPNVGRDEAANEGQQHLHGLLELEADAVLDHDGVGGDGARQLHRPVLLRASTSERESDQGTRTKGAAGYRTHQVVVPRGVLAQNGAQVLRPQLWGLLLREDARE